MNGAPVYWNSPTYGPAIYVWPAGDPLKVFRLVGGLFTTPASAQSTALAAGGMPGGMLSLSANGSAAGTGILWATLSRGGDANHAPQPGILRAYDASNVTRELWNSQQNADAGTRSATFRSSVRRRWRTDKVYVATLSNKLVVYGLIGPSGGNTAPVVNAGVDQNLTSPGTHDPDGIGNRRRQPGAAGAAHDDVEPRQRAGVSDVRRAECALDERDVPGAWHLYASASPRSTARPRRATT